MPALQFNGANYTQEISLGAVANGLSSKAALALVATNAGAVPAGVNTAVVYVDTNAYFRCTGAADDAASDGTDQFLAANNTYRISVVPGNRLSLIADTVAGNYRRTWGA